MIMTKYEEINKTSDRFIIVYSQRKLFYLKDMGFTYLFKCFNDRTYSPFWVFDVSPEIREALDNYDYENKRPNIENN